MELQTHKIHYLLLLVSHKYFISMREVLELTVSQFNEKLKNSIYY